MTPTRDRALAVVAAAFVLCGVSSLALLGWGSAGKAHRPTTTARLPLEARLALSRGIAADQRQYWPHRARSGLATATGPQRMLERFGRARVTVAVGAGWVGVATRSFGRPGRESAVAPASPGIDRNRVSYPRAGLLEWYANGPLGLEQGFTLDARPAGQGPVSLRLSLSGSLRGRLAGSTALALSTPSGPTALMYRDLSATDARGRPLKAWLGLTGRSLTLSVDDRGARYPLRVDPTFETAKLTASDGAANDLLGSSIAIDGSTAVVGAPGAVVGGHNGQGAAYVFVEPGTGWATAQETAKLTASDGATFDALGTSVGISGDTIVVGAPLNNSQHGAAYVFVKPAGGWGSVGPPQNETAKLTSSGSNPDRFGSSVAISGDTVVAEAPRATVGSNAGQGAGYVFVKPVGGWGSVASPQTETAQLTASDGASGDGSAADGAGPPMAISGDTVAMGVDTKTVGGNAGQGEAYVFVKPGGGWGSVSPQPEAARLTASDGAANDSLGISIGVSGDTIVAGAARAFVGASSGAGAVYVFVKPVGGWGGGAQPQHQTGKLAASDDGGGQLGRSAAIAGDTVVAGAPLTMIGSTGAQGAAYTFVKPGGGWGSSTQPQTETAKLVASDGATQDELGEAPFGVSVSGTTAIAGAVATINGHSRQGAAYVFPVSALPPNRTLTVSLAGSGSGSVSGDQPPAISCPGACSQQYADGTTVTLTETPAAGSTFAGWSGGGCPATDTTCKVTLSADTTVTATFAPVTPALLVTLTVNMAGSRTGMVTGSGNFLCFKTSAPPGKCSQSYSYGTTVILHAASTAGSTFTGWSSGVCAFYGFGDCTLKMNGSQTVTANFNPPPKLTLTIAGSGVGNITGGAFCGFPYTPFAANSTTCTSTFKTATTITLHANPFSGSTFTGWTGDCTGTGACKLTMSGDHSVTATFSFDAGVQVNAMEVTQGIQTPELPTRSSTTPSGYRVAYSGTTLPDTGNQPVTVKLAEDHATVVRVYVNTRVARPNGIVPTMVLRAYRNGHLLAPGPIGPDQTPPSSAVPVGPLGGGDYMNYTQRYDPNGAYTFTLPWGWAEGDIRLEAQANPDGNLPPCSNSCDERSISLDNVHFNPVTEADIYPIAFLAALKAPQGYPNVDPQWEQVQAVTPFPIYIHPYVQVTSALQTISGCDGPIFAFVGGSTQTFAQQQAAYAASVYSARNAALRQVVTDWANANDTDPAHYAFGLVPAGVPSTCASAGGYGGGQTNGGALLYKAQPRSISTDDRPRSGMAHEFGHGLGLPHAGVECGSGADASADAASSNSSDQTDDGTNQTGESWPPSFAASTGVPVDGLLDGIGLVGLENRNGSPYTVVPPAPSARPAGWEVYDLMSYCGGTNEVGSWISVRNWNRDVEFHAPGPTSARDATASAYRTEPPSAPGKTRTLAVTAVYDLGTGRTLAFELSPDQSVATAAQPGATYSLSALDASGRVVATAGVIASPIHVDHAPSEILIVGKIPATGAREVELLQDGQLIGAVKASAHAPTVTILSPHKRTLIGGGHGALLRWRSHDADGGSLQATVRYSANDGRTWRTIFSGPDQGTARLPSGLLSASRRARIRVYISDGFNDAIATSRRFVALGAPPSVTISTPSTGTRVPAGASVNLRGTAYDDTGARLTGRALAWRAGRQLLGRGDFVTTVTLPAGRHVITLSARDGRGRTSTASVRVRIEPSPPTVTLLRAPRRISARARTIMLRLALLAPTTLTAGRQHYLVGRQPKSVRVHIKPSRKPLILRLILRSGPYVRAVPLVIIR